MSDTYSNFATKISFKFFVVCLQFYQSEKTFEIQPSDYFHSIKRARKFEQRRTCCGYAGRRTGRKRNILIQMS